jgi:hypothetical protein
MVFQTGKIRTADGWNDIRTEIGKNCREFGATKFVGPK